MASPSQIPPPPSPFVVLLSGTHVTGKETLALKLSSALKWKWIEGDMPHASARFGARSQAARGLDYAQVFGRIWLTKLMQLGFLSEGSTSPDGCAGLITTLAMRPPARDAMRAALGGVGVRAVFVIMQINTETLEGRTVGAEEPELAERILEEKIKDIQEPGEEEEDVILVEAVRDVDSLFEEIMGKIGERVGRGGGG